MSSAAAEWTTVIDVLRHRAADDPDGPAYVFLADGEQEGEQLTFAALRDRADRIGRAIRERAAPGERVLLLFPPGLDFVASFFACLDAGAVAVPAYPPRPNRPTTATRAIEADSRPALVLTGLELKPSVEQAVDTAAIATVEELDAGAPTARESAIDPSSLALLQYTSGSTSEPRGVMVTHANLLHNQRLMAAALGPLPGPAVSWLPLYHDMGLIGHVLYPLYCGVTSVLMSPLEFLQRPASWLEAISSRRGAIATAPNFAYDLCVRRVDEQARARLDLSCWTLALDGAEPVRSDTIHRFAQAFAGSGFDSRHLFPCYGLAEATLFVTGGPREAGPRLLYVDGAALERDEIVPCEADRADARCLVSSGRAWIDLELAIVDPESRTPCPDDRIGEIWIRGPSVAAGYWNRPEETEQVFRARLAGDESQTWLRSGDLGCIREGQLFVTGRLKDLIIAMGRNHYPQDLERTAETCHRLLAPGRGAAFTARIGDAERLVIAHEVVRSRLSDIDERDIVERMRQAIAEHHDLRLHDVVLLLPGALPRTTSGKVRRHACRQGFLDRTLRRVTR